MSILKKFFGNKDEKKEKVEVINCDELKDLISDIFLQVDNITFIKSEHWIESNICRGEKESFDNFTKKIEEEGLSLELGAGEYTIMKNIKNNKGSISSILCKFKFEEIKNEDLI